MNFKIHMKSSIFFLVYTEMTNMTMRNSFRLIINDWCSGIIFLFTNLFQNVSLKGFIGGIYTCDKYIICITKCNWLHLLFEYICITHIFHI